MAIAPVQPPVITWEKLPADYVLPDDPVDNIQQPPLAAALTNSLFEAGRLHPTALTPTNYGICATVNGQTVVKAPDWAYVPQVSVSREEVFKSYTPHLQGDLPLIVMEFLSDTDGGEYSMDPTYPPGKWYFYEQILKVPYYAIFEPVSGDLAVYRLDPTGRYRTYLRDEAGRYWIPEMSLALSAWYGPRENDEKYWLRWWDEAGNLLLWSSEKAQQERQCADEERQRADEEQQRADEEQQRADEERQRADEERQRADEERQRADRLAAQLRALGYDPDNL